MGPSHDLPRRSRSQQREQQQIGVSAILRSSLVATLLASGQYFLLAFSLLDLRDVHHLGVILGGVVLMVAEVGGGVGRIVSGLVSDRLGGNRPRVIVACVLLASGMALIACCLPSSASASILFDSRLVCFRGWCGRLERFGDDMGGRLGPPGAFRTGDEHGWGWCYFWSGRVSADIWRTD